MTSVFYFEALFGWKSQIFSIFFLSEEIKKSLSNQPYIPEVHLLLEVVCSRACRLLEKENNLLKKLQLIRRMILQQFEASEKAQNLFLLSTWRAQYERLKRKHCSSIMISIHYELVL